MRCFPGGLFSAGSSRPSACSAALRLRNSVDSSFARLSSASASLLLKERAHLLDRAVHRATSRSMNVSVRGRAATPAPPRALETPRWRPHAGEARPPTRLPLRDRNDAPSSIQIDCTEALRISVPMFAISRSADLLRVFLPRIPRSPCGSCSHGLSLNENGRDSDVAIPANRQQLVRAGPRRVEALGERKLESGLAPELDPDWAVAPPRRRSPP